MKAKKSNKLVRLLSKFKEFNIYVYMGYCLLKFIKELRDIMSFFQWAKLSFFSGFQSLLSGKRNM